MRIGGIRTLDGPNVYHSRPVLVMQLYLEDLDGRESRDFVYIDDIVQANMRAIICRKKPTEREVAEADAICDCAACVSGV